MSGQGVSIKKDALVDFAIVSVCIGLDRFDVDSVVSSIKDRGYSIAKSVVRNKLHSLAREGYLGEEGGIYYTEEICTGYLVWLEGYIVTLFDHFNC